MVDLYKIADDFEFLAFVGLSGQEQAFGDCTIVCNCLLCIEVDWWAGKNSNWS